MSTLPGLGKLIDVRTSATAGFGVRVGEARYVFSSLRSAIEVAHCLTEVIDNAVRFELGRYKISAGYRRFRHQDRHMANSSFTVGMIASIAGKLKVMKKERDTANNVTGRDLVVLKASVVDAELEKLNLKLRTVRRTTRMVSPTAYEAGGAAGASLARRVRWGCLDATGLLRLSLTVPTRIVITLAIDAKVFRFGAAAVQSLTARVCVAFAHIHFLVLANINMVSCSRLGITFRAQSTIPNEFGRCHPEVR
jgi:hypothetical protein